MIENKINELNKSISINNRKIDLMKKLSTSKGFFQYYFSLLKSSVTNEDAFCKVNELYLQHFGETRFNNYIEFRNSLKSSFKF
jgi:hypothetical protein